MRSAFKEVVRRRNQELHESIYLYEKAKLQYHLNECKVSAISYDSAIFACLQQYKTRAELNMLQLFTFSEDSKFSGDFIQEPQMRALINSSKQDEPLALCCHLNKYSW